jgi:hypothetical protein
MKKSQSDYCLYIKLSSDHIHYLENLNSTTQIFFIAISIFNIQSI